MVSDPALMTLQDFSVITIKVIQKNSFADYLPTLVLPDIKKVRVIDGIPSQTDHRKVVQNIVRRTGHRKKEFFFGVKSGPSEITVGHHRPGRPTEFMIIKKTNGRYKATPV